MNCRGARSIGGLETYQYYFGGFLLCLLYSMTQSPTPIIKAPTLLRNPTALSRDSPRYLFVYRLLVAKAWADSSQHGSRGRLVLKRSVGGTWPVVVGTHTSLQHSSIANHALGCAHLASTCYAHLGEEGDMRSSTLNSFDLVLKVPCLSISLLCQVTNYHRTTSASGNQNTIVELTIVVLFNCGCWYSSH